MLGRVEALGLTFIRRRQMFQFERGKFEGATLTTLPTSMACAVSHRAAWHKQLAANCDSRPCLEVGRKGRPGSQVLR